MRKPTLPRYLRKSARSTGFCPKRSGNMWRGPGRTRRSSGATRLRRSRQITMAAPIHTKAAAARESIGTRLCRLSHSGRILGDFIRFTAISGNGPKIAGMTTTMEPLSTDPRIPPKFASTMFFAVVPGTIILSWSARRTASGTPQMFVALFSGSAWRGRSTNS